MDRRYYDMLLNSRKMLNVTVYVDAQEGPNDISQVNCQYYDVEALMTGRWYGGDYGFYVEKIEDECITVSCFGRILEVGLGTGSRSASYEEHPPYMVRYITHFTFEYRVVEPKERFIQFICQLMERYRDRLNVDSLSEDRRLALELIDRHIQDGWVELYPMKALMSSCSSLKRLKIDDWAMYEEIMYEGFLNHCLRSKSSVAKEWVSKAWAGNDLDEVFSGNVVLCMYYKKQQP